MTEPKTTTEPLVKVEISNREWKVIQVLRQVRYGKLTIQKQAGQIIMIEPAPTIKVDERMDIHLEVDVE